MAENPNPPHEIFHGYYGVWTMIGSLLDGRSLAMIAATDRMFNEIMMSENLWRRALLRDFNLPDLGEIPAAFSWNRLYASAFDGSHSFLFHQQNLHIEWRRIGAFFLRSDTAVLTDCLNPPLVTHNGEHDAVPVERAIKEFGVGVLSELKTGIWIADYHRNLCHICGHTCGGIEQTLEVRHIELFLSERYINGDWDYEELAVHNLADRPAIVQAGILHIDHVRGDQAASEILNLQQWVGEPHELVPRTIVAHDAVAMHFNMPENQRLLSCFEVMGAEPERDVVAIRIYNRPNFHE